MLHCHPIIVWVVLIKNGIFCYNSNLWRFVNKVGMGTNVQWIFSEHGL